MKSRYAASLVLSTLKEHREAHVIELTKATAIWKDKMRVACANLQADIDELGTKSPHLRTMQSLLHKKPVDNVKSYDDRIGMIDKADTSEVELDEEDYDQVFNDNWHWRSAGKFTNQSYIDGTD